MHNSGIVRDKLIKEVGFSLEDLQLPKGTRSRKFKNGLNFERVKIDTIFGHNEAQNSTSRNTKNTLKRMEVNVILATSKEYGM